jgi:hypothetical protein
MCKHTFRNKGTGVFHVTEVETLDLRLDACRLVKTCHPTEVRLPCNEHGFANAHPSAVDRCNLRLQFHRMADTFLDGRKRRPWVEFRQRVVIEKHQPIYAACQVEQDVNAHHTHLLSDLDKEIEIVRRQPDLRIASMNMRNARTRPRHS